MILVFLECALSMVHADCQMTTKIYLRSTKAYKKMLQLGLKAYSQKSKE